MFLSYFMMWVWFSFWSHKCFISDFSHLHMHTTVARICLWFMWCVLVRMHMEGWVGWFPVTGGFMCCCRGIFYASQVLILFSCVCVFLQHDLPTMSQGTALFSCGIMGKCFYIHWMNTSHTIVLLCRDAAGVCRRCHVKNLLTSASLLLLLLLLSSSRMTPHREQRPVFEWNKQSWNRDQ